MKKIAILGAMQMEIKPILQDLDSYEELQYANNKFYLASYNNKQLIIACSKIGKVLSAMTATIMIEHFGAQALLFTGIAGGLKDLKIGDVIAATSTIQHDVDLTAFGHQHGKIPNFEVNVQTCKKLLAQAQKAARELNINLQTGVIATSDQFVNSAKKRDFIVDKFAAKAVEMEGGSINFVCNQMNVPSLILRTISDVADGEAADNFEQFAKIAANRSAQLIMKVVDNI